MFISRSVPDDLSYEIPPCAIENMWLAARAEGLGMGWVSLFDAEKLAELLNMPAGSKPIAVLCLGPVEAFYVEPMLLSAGWAKRENLQRLVFENSWDRLLSDINDNE